VHALPSLQTTGVWVHPVAVHLSMVHLLLSQHLSLSGVNVHFPVVESHPSTVQQTLSSQTFVAQGLTGAGAGAGAE
jgi:hypothetical protein